MRRIIMPLLVASMIAGCAGSKGPNERTLRDAAAENANSSDSLQPKVDYNKAARLYIELGLAYLKDGQVGRAKVKLLRAKKLAPQLPEVYYALGFYMESVGEFDQAKQYYLTAIQRNPKDGKARNNYGTFLCRQGQYLESEKEFIAAIDDPNYTQTAEALENAGFCMKEVPDLVKAKQYFEHAVRMDPRRVNALLELSYMNYQAAEYGAASEHLSQYNLEANQTPRSLWLAIKLAQRVNDHNKAGSLTMSLKQQFPNSQEMKDIQQGA